MKKIISVLQMTTRQTVIGLVVLGLIVVAAPMAVFADPSEDAPLNKDLKVEICHKGEIITVDDEAVDGHKGHGDFVITNDNRDTCKKHKEGDDNDNKSNLIVKKVVVNSQANPSTFSFKINDGSSVSFDEDGNNTVSVTNGENTVTEVDIPEGFTASYASNVDGHAHDCTDIVVGVKHEGDEGDDNESDSFSHQEDFTPTCTITNTYHAPETPKTCVFGSDATTLVGTAAAVPSFVHPNWTSALVSASPLTQWIWNAFHATPSDTTDEVVTFTKKFNVVGTPSSVKLDLAADNYYSVSVNGIASCADQTHLDNFSAVEPTCDIKSLVHTGVNTLTFVVTNKSGFGTNPETQNPGGLIYKVTIGGATCSEVPTEPTFAKVHLYKYLANGKTETQVPDTFTGPQFPMVATWSALNIGAGSGAYALGYGHGGAAFKWAADTSAMQEPVVHYTSSEVTGGDSPVVASREQCAPGKYFLKGYRSGTSLEGAEEATLTSTAPDYTNFTGDRYVIVVNQACPAAPTTSSVSATKVVCTDEKDLPNWGAGGPDITATTATNWVAEHKSCSIVPWDFQWAPSSALNPGDNLPGTPESWTSFVSGLATVPANALVWVREKINSDYIPFTGASSTNNVSAEMYCSNDVLNYDNFDFIDQAEHVSTYYCVGFNAPKAPPQTQTSQTIVVKAADLDSTSSNPFVVLADGLNKWFFYNDTTDVVDNSIGSFVTGPATAPLGTGSAEMNDPAANSRPDIATFQFSGTKLADITTLAFSSYSNPGTSGAGPTESPYLVFNVDFTGTLGAFQNRLVYVPGNNGAVPQNAWNTNDTIQGGAGKWVYSGTTWPGGVIPGTTAKTWAQILSDYPNARLLPAGGFMGVRVGEPGPTGYTGNVDKFVIGIKTGSNTDTRTYDFEPTPVVVDVCSNIQGTQATVPDGMTVNDGVCTTPVVVTPTVTTPTSNGGGRSGSRRGGGGGSVLGASTGQVLGESCGLYLEKHLRFGSKKNDSEQTKKLQTFLNKWMGTTLPISGMYDSATEKAVKAFQAKYASDILTPWKIGGPTGLVYFTTLHKINELECPEAAGAKPTNLIDWSKNKNAQ